MDEINNVKRLYERHVKLGYNKILNPDKVAQATNVDSAIRKWQISKAKDLGFNNIIDMNKQTQLSKFIVDKLGDQVIGQSALNSIGLTDWIVLGSGSPEAVSAFLTKKFFSSRAVQAKIAELLNVGQPVKSIISPDVKPTIESSLRSQWPEGTLLELPPASSQFRTSMPSQGTIKIAPTGSAMDITSEPGINLSSKPAQPPVLEKSRISSSNSSIKNANSQGGFIDIGKMSSDIKSLFQEAKKYKTAEEFVKKQIPISHYTAQKFNKFDLSKTEAGSVWFTDNSKIDLKSGQGLGSAQVGTGGAKYKLDRYINPNAKIIDIETSNLTDKYTTGQLIDMGYSGIKVPQLDGSNWYEIFNPNIDLLTKSQLTDIWKKANNKK